MSPKFDLSNSSRESALPEYFEHPDAGYIQYDPNTLYISANRDGHSPIHVPIKMVGKFFGTKQPNVPTCSEPGEGNRGCPKWAGCPFKAYKHIGPGNVIMEKHGNVSMSACYDYFETTHGGRPVSQLHHGMDGWKLNTERTSINILGRTWAFAKGLLNVNSTTNEIMAVPAKRSEMEIGDLLPPWWPLMKKKGLPLPPSAQHYPELTDDDEEPVAPEKRGRPKKVVA